MKFIITADDYGVSPIIDEAIEDAARAKRITSVAAFANTPGEVINGEPVSFDVSKVAAFQRQFPEISVGLHLSLTSGFRVAESSTSLGRKNGNNRLLKGPINQLAGAKAEHVFDEIKAQIALFQNAGIRIHHFSDHHGILNHTEIGKEALFAAVEEYNRTIDAPASIRNPVFLSALVTDRRNPLDKSNASKAASLPLFLRGIFRRASRSRSERREISFKLGLKEQKKLLEEMMHRGIPSSDYFVDHFWGAWNRGTPRHIFNHKNYRNVDPGHLLSLRANEKTAEVMMHIAKSDRDFRGDYEGEIKKIHARGGIDISYVKNGRLQEARLLRKFLNKYCKPQDRISFKREGVVEAVIA